MRLVAASCAAVSVGVICSAPKSERDRICRTALIRSQTLSSVPLRRTVSGFVRLPSITAFHHPSLAESNPTRRDDSSATYRAAASPCSAPRTERVTVQDSFRVAVIGCTTLGGCPVSPHIHKHRRECGSARTCGSPRGVESQPEVGLKGIETDPAMN